MLFRLFPLHSFDLFTHVIRLLNLKYLGPSQGDYSLPLRTPLNKCVKELVCAQTLLQ